MYIHRVVWKDVPGIPDRDLTFFDGWTGKPLRSVLITGPNGTGKTTMLRVIAGLWSDYGTWLTQAPVGVLIPRNVRRSGLVAMEVRNFARDPVWFFSARSSEYHNQFISTVFNSNSILIGEIRGDPNTQMVLPGFEVDPTDHSVQEHPIKRPSASHMEVMSLVNESEDWPSRVSTLAHKLQLGVPTEGETLPNVVFLRAESREVGVRTPSDKTTSEALFRWLAEYNARARSSQLEVMLRNLKIRDEHWFKQTLEHINMFLKQNGKYLTDFNDSLRLRVETGQRSGMHYIEDLSAGEQQCLLLIFMVSRWLMPGGVVLIDEPDLHMHGSWQRTLIHELERLVNEKEGQLIITSHSDLLVDEFGESQRFHLELEKQQP